MSALPRHTLLLRLAFCAALIAVFVLSVLPAPYEPKLFSWQDKVEHLLIFCGLTLLGRAAWPRHSRAVVAGILVYGAAMELGQSLTTYRMGDVRDWVADALGVALAALAAHLSSRSRRR